MKLFYAATTRIPSDWAHVVQIMAMCDALAGNGADVELIVPCRSSTDFSRDPFAEAGLDRTFALTYVSAIDVVSTGRPHAHDVLARSYRFSLSRHLRQTQRRGDVLYVRSEILLPHVRGIASDLPIFWETHEKPNHEPRYREVLDRLSGVVSTTAYYAGQLRGEWGLEPGRVLHAPNGVNLNQFDGETPQAARERLAIPTDARVLMYVGHLAGSKGREALLAAADELSPDILTVIIGGHGRHEELRVKHPTLRFLGNRPYAELANNLRAADVVVLPNSGQNVENRYTSPLKLFAYMASGKPIVASDLASIREVASDRDVFFVPPDDPKALACMVRYVFENSRLAQAKAASAKRAGLTFSWDWRARAVLAFIDRRT